MKSSVALAEAAASSQLKLVKCMVEEEKVDINTVGKDGTSPLCAAALWGDADMVKYLLAHGADPNVSNTGTGWTALHAAAFQEHGKVVHILLRAQADPTQTDVKGRSAADYATIAPGIWPFFQAKGCSKTPKAVLIEKGIIRKAEAPTVPPSPTRGIHRELPHNALRELSRPGSAYVRVQFDPRQPVADAVGRQTGGYPSMGQAVAGAGGPVGAGSVDPFSHVPRTRETMARTPSFKGLRL